MREPVPQPLQPGGAGSLPGVRAAVTMRVTATAILIMTVNVTVTVTVNVTVIVAVMRVLLPVHAAHRGTGVRLQPQPSYTP
ncbi:hypothetical protein GCM10009601_00110 [Streptomyces thermospinosisporus]|uniref:Uncharacterized protein n=1 Tax=Streptomyces thermospinosisporus TaxID=161482 RepID=A0ABN1YHY7_9ACTN